MHCSQNLKWQLRIFLYMFPDLKIENGCQSLFSVLPVNFRGQYKTLTIQASDILDCSVRSQLWWLKLNALNKSMQYHFCLHWFIKHLLDIVWYTFTFSINTNYKQIDLRSTSLYYYIPNPTCIHSLHFLIHQNKVLQTILAS